MAATGMVALLVVSTAPAPAFAGTSAVHILRMNTGHRYKNGAEVQMSPALTGASGLSLPANADVEAFLDWVVSPSGGNSATP